MPKSHKYISRIETYKTFGWQFRFYQPVMSKFFSDGVHKSKTKALRAAILYRNKTLRKLKKVAHLTASKPVKRATQDNNTSGIVGVKFYIDSRWDDNGSWHAEYVDDDGSKHRRTFGIDKHGMVVAFQNACAIRYEKHGDLLITCPIKELPAKPEAPYILAIQSHA